MHRSSSPKVNQNTLSLNYSEFNHQNTSPKKTNYFNIFNIPRIPKKNIQSITNRSSIDRTQELSQQKGISLPTLKINYSIQSPKQLNNIIETNSDQNNSTIMSNLMNKQNNTLVTKNIQQLIDDDFMSNPNNLFNYITSNNIFANYNITNENNSNINDTIVNNTVQNNPRLDTKNDYYQRNIQDFSQLENRSKYILLNLSNQNLKERMMKNENCRYCNIYAEKINLFYHLRKHVYCATLYMRQYKLKSIDSILIKQYKCINCDDNENFKLLKPHLKSSTECLMIYQKWFGVNNLNELFEKIEKIRKQNRPSRTAKARHSQYTKKKSDQTTETITDAINAYKQSTVLANYRLCFLCLGNFLDTKTYEVKLNDKLYTDNNLMNNNRFKRMNKFYVCSICKFSKKKIPEKYKRPKMKSIVLDGKTIYYESDTENKDIIDDKEIDTLSYVLIPKNLKVPNKYTKLPFNVYKCNILNNSILSTMYDNHCFKYYVKKFCIERYEGIIESNSEKKLSLIKPIFDDSQIRQSDTWNNRTQSGIESRFEQIGNHSIGFNILIPINNQESICTALLIQESVLSVEFHSDRNYEFETKYFLHNHTVETECNNSCRTKEIDEEDFSSVDLLESRYLQVFISTIHQKTYSILKNFVNNSNWELSSTEYYMYVRFYENGNASLQCIIWPKQCETFNENLSKSSLTGENIDNTPYLQFITKSIITISHPEDLMTKFDYSYEEAVNTSEMIMKLQVKLDNQHEIILPSLNCILSIEPEEKAIPNIYQSRVLKEFLTYNIHQLTLNEKKTLTTKEWLYNIKSTLKIILLNDIIIIKTNEYIVEFIIEKRLQDMIKTYEDEFIGLYHYSLTCTSKSNTIIMKRENIIESFTIPYNIHLLKAVTQPLSFETYTCFNDWLLTQDIFEYNMTKFENTPLEKFIKTHKLVTLAEFFSLTDKNIISELTSSKVEFVSTSIDSKPKFKRSSKKTLETYQSNNKTEYYIQLSSNIKRYETRINGHELLLIETVLWYDNLKKKETEQIFSIYKDNISKIPLSDIKSIYGENCMPEYILCETNEVLKIRKTRNIIQTPNFSKESDNYKFSKVLLYYPTLPNAKIDIERLGNKTNYTKNIIIVL